MTTIALLLVMQARPEAKAAQALCETRADVRAVKAQLTLVAKLLRVTGAVQNVKDRERKAVVKEAIERMKDRRTK